jgi:tetratricopeptide (TPR) repeat protein
MTAPATHAELQAWQRAAEAALEEKDYRRAHALCMTILAAQPLSVDAFFLLALIAAEHANFGKALDVLGRALRIDPRRPELHAQRARCLLALHQQLEATQAALQAMHLEPTNALTFDTIGVVLTRAGAQLEALEPFRQAVRLAPDNPSYRYNLATTLQFAGDFSGAEAAYRATIRLDPKHHRAWSALAQLRRDSLTNADVDFLERWLADGTLDADTELHVRHALAKHEEDHGRHAAAFAHLAAGKRRKRASLRYSFDADLRLFEAVRAVCTREFCSTGDGHASREPIFVVGMPRTGTTLVERILSSHPAVHSVGELTNFALTVKRAARTPSAYVFDVDTLFAARTLDYAQIGRDYIQSTRPRTGHTTHFVDKMPLNFLCAGLIHRALPEARIICLRRNALDTCLSNYRQLFATSFPYYHYAYDLLDIGRYYQQFDALAAHWRESIPERFMEVHYEDVVDHTEREAQRLLAFCGLSFTPEVLAFHDNAAPVATASAVQVRQPIYRTSLDRWRHYERELAPLLELLGPQVR